MPGHFIETVCPEYRMRKHDRLKVLQKTVAYPLNPARQYERDCAMILRAVGRFIYARGFCPNTKAIAFARTWNEKATRAYLEDLLGYGYLEVYFKTVWDVSQRGWDFLGIVPIVPIVPYSLSVKANNVCEMRHVIGRLGTPELAEAYESFLASRRAKAPLVDEE